MQEACSGGNDASNQEKTSEPMDSVGTDGVDWWVALRDNHTAVEAL